MRARSPEADTAPGVPAPDTDDRRVDVEVVKVVAIVLVVAIHVAAPPLIAEVDAGRTASLYWTALVLDSFSRAGVPLFFAAAGWAHLVTAPARSWPHLRDRVLRVVRPLAVWSVFYVVWDRTVLRWLDGGAADGVGVVDDLAWGIATGSGTRFHLWYLYSYIPLVLALGLVALLRRSAGEAQVDVGAVRSWLPPTAALVVVAALPSLLDLAATVAGEEREVLWALPLHVVALALLGAVLLTLRPEASWRPSGLGLFAAGVAGTMVWAHRYGYERPFEYDSAVTFAATVGLLLMLRGITVARPEVWRRLSGMTLGIYLVHIAVRDLAMLVLPTTGSGGWDRAALVTLLQLPVVLGGSLLLVALWQRSTGLRRWLG